MGQTSLFLTSGRFLKWPVDNKSKVCQLNENTNKNIETMKNMNCKLLLGFVKFLKAITSIGTWTLNSLNIVNRLWFLNSLLDNKTIKADLCYLDGETTVFIVFHGLSSIGKKCHFKLWGLSSGPDIICLHILLHRIFFLCSKICKQIMSLDQMRDPYMIASTTALLSIFISFYKIILSKVL